MALNITVFSCAECSSIHLLSQKPVKRMSLKMSTLVGICTGFFDMPP